jgi:hypothetical protein
LLGSWIAVTAVYTSSRAADLPDRINAWNAACGIEGPD